jgi:hypothetical protein
MKRPPNSGDDSQLQAAERRARVVELRRGRLTFAEIGKEMGFSAQRAHQVYVAALTAVPALQVDEHRAEEMVLIDDAIADLLIIAKNHKQPRTSVEAWNSVRGWAERKAKLLGLDAPTKAEIGGQLTYEVVGVGDDQL